MCVCIYSICKYAGAGLKILHCCPVAIYGIALCVYIAMC